MKSSPLRGGFALFAAILFAFPNTNASAQTPDTWLAWEGCWRADGAPLDETLCIVPDGAGVRMITLEKNVVRGESRVIADNKPRPINQDGCTGSEVARWSADHRRVFLISQLTCDQKIARQVTGIFAITGLREWVSAQAVTIEGKTATRSVHYTAVEPENLPRAVTAALRTDRAIVQAARGAAYHDITEAEINEAIDNIEVAAVQEWLTATGQPYQLAGQNNAPTTMSALDLVGRAANNAIYEPAVEPTVVERVTYVNTTYVNNVVRSCWDPFYSGYVVGIGYGHVGVSYGRPACGGRYYGRYSPWGYDLFGWHWFPSPVVVVRPTIIRTTPFIHRGPAIRRDWDRHDWDDRRNWDDRRDWNDRSSSSGARATRDGYTRSTGSTGDNRFDRDNRGTSGRTTGTRATNDDRGRSFPPPRGTPTRTSTQPPRSTPTRTSTQPPRGDNGRGQTTTSGRNGASATTRTVRSTPSGYSSRSSASRSSSSSSGRTAQPKTSSNR